jgi:MFS family permease
MLSFRRRPLPGQSSGDRSSVPAAGHGRVPIPPELRVLLAAAFVIALGFGLVAPVLPQFARSFNVGVAASSIIVSAFAFARLVFAPAGGALILRLGERSVYVLGVLIVAVSTGACAFAQDYWQLLVFRGLGGLGSTMFTVSSMALLVRLAPPGIRGRVSGAYASAFLLGSICGPAVGGLLAGLGLRVPFLVYAAALVLAAAVVFTRLRIAGPSGRNPHELRPPLAIREALRDSAYRASLVSNFANGWSALGVRMALIPLFATTSLGAGPEIAGIALAVFAVGTAVSLTFSGRLTDSLGRKPLILSGLLINGIGTAAIGFTTNIPLFLAVAVIAGLGAGMLGPAQQAAVADSIGSDKSAGKVLAVSQMSSDTGAILGPVFAGLLADSLSYGWAFALTGATALAAFAVWTKARESMPSRQEHSRQAH